MVPFFILSLQSCMPLGLDVRTVVVAVCSMKHVVGILIQRLMCCKSAASQLTLLSQQLLDVWHASVCDRFLNQRNAPAIKRLSSFLTGCCNPPNSWSNAVQSMKHADSFLNSWIIQDFHRIFSSMFPPCTVTSGFTTCLIAGTCAVLDFGLIPVIGLEDLMTSRLKWRQPWCGSYSETAKHYWQSVLYTMIYQCINVVYVDCESLKIWYDEPSSFIRFLLVDAVWWNN